MEPGCSACLPQRSTKPLRLLRKTQFAVEDALSGFIGAQAIASTAPPLPLGSSRFQFQGKRARLDVGDNATTLNMGFGVAPASGLSQPLSRAAHEMDKFDYLLGAQPSFFCSLSLTANFSANSLADQIEAAQCLHAALMLPRSSKLNNLAITTGFTDGMYIREYTISMYQGITFTSSTNNQ